MHWLMKVMLFILSCTAIFSCETKETEKKAKEFDVTNAIDSLFNWSTKWKDTSIPCSDELILKIASHLENVNAHLLGNNIDPNAIIFTSTEKTNLNEFIKSDRLKKCDKSKFNNYSVWLTNIGTKKILEFSLQPHPTEKWVFSIRKRNQE
ncbi:MAG: hypothetical protein WED10_06855 [Brumimicrobium sp.]